MTFIISISKICLESQRMKEEKLGKINLKQTNKQISKAHYF